MSLESLTSTTRSVSDAPAWSADAELAADITPTGKAAVASRAVVVTGATGFLGSHLVRALLTRKRGSVYCLARSSTRGSAAARVTRALQLARGAPPVSSDRLTILESDLSAPSLGLSSQLYAALAGKVSTIIHCAADVSWSRPYAKLHAANVAPISHLLRLACHGPTKHFVLISSMAVCYSTNPRLYTSEHSDPSVYLDEIPLGYAQSKAVAESLVRQAVARGLNATIVRPALITGHSSGGHVNAEDFVSWLISGCVRMGWAPDVDWRLDVVPVDYVAAAIAANLEHPDGLRTLHIAHPEPRDWRELVLFLNLYGYEVRLETFERWRERLINFSGETLPLQRFVKFFSERAVGSDGLTVAQIYEAGGRPRISSAHSTAYLISKGLPFPKLNAAYFAQYLSSLVHLKLLRPPSSGPPSRRQGAPIDQAVLRALQPIANPLVERNVADLRPAHFEASGSITMEISSWRHGGRIGLYGVASGHCRSGEADLVLKIKALDEEAIATLVEVASICSPRLGLLMAQFSRHLDHCGASDRETAIYTVNCPAITEHIPRCHAIGREPASNRPMLLLERLTDAALLDSVDRPDLWTDGHIRTAIRDLATIHAVWHGCEQAGRAEPRFIRRLSATEITDAIELWNALYIYGKEFYVQCGGDALTTRIETLLSTAPEWALSYVRQPATLVHNDCNPRNMAFRRTAQGLSTCLYDWELCTIAPPQRDLAELLCFTLGATSCGERVRHYVELHRRQLSQNTGRVIDAEIWNQGFRLALADLMLRRLTMYTMLHSYVRQTYLPRVMRCWQALDRALRC